MLTLISLATLLAAGLASGAPYDGPIDCAKVEDLLNEYGPAQGLTTLSAKYPPWSTEDELAKRCPVSQDAIKTLKRINKECFSGLTQQVLSAALKSRQQLTEESCVAGSQRLKDSVAASKCIKENAFDEMKKAEHDVIRVIQVLLDTAYPDNKERIRRSCCATTQGKELVMGVTRAKCPAHEKVISDYLDSYMNDALNIICTDPTKLQCDKVEPIKFDAVQAKYDFYVIPILKMIKTLDL